MFDSLFNLLIVLIPISIFIGRAVVQARSKHAPPPQRESRPLIHFEEEEDEDVPHWQRASALEYSREPAAKPALKPAGAARTPQSFADKIFKDLYTDTKPDVPSLASAEISPSAAIKKVQANVPLPKERKEALPSGPFNLGRLSPLQQAVVMAEILGPPAALR